jgi:hypothetical protein
MNQPRHKGSYFSVRFSASLLERLESARVEYYGERTSLAETIRRLLEERLTDVTTRSQPKHLGPRDVNMSDASVSSMPIRAADVGVRDRKLTGGEQECLRHLDMCPLAVEIAHVALAVERLVQRGVELGASEVSLPPPPIQASATIARDRTVEVMGA